MKKIFLFLFLFMVLFSAATSAQDNIEKKKIEFLIASVAHLQGAKFIRNGNEHDGIEAAKHLRLKLEKAGSRIKTVDDFIKLCASRSSMTGKPYQIKFSNGKTIPAEIFLREKMKEYNEF